MICRRCLKTIEGDSDDTAGTMLTAFGHSYPTVICIECFDEWYMSYKDEVILLGALVGQYKSIKYTKPTFQNLVDMTTAVAKAEYDLNAKAIAWMRRGVEI